MSSINVEYIGEQGLNTALTLLKAEIDDKANSTDIPDVSGFATTSDVTNGLNGKAEVDHNHTQSEITGLSDTLGNINTTLGGKSNIGHTHTQNEINDLETALDGKVDKVSGKVLSDVNFTSTEKDKLEHIEEYAQANVNADWNSNGGASRILNKPENLVQDVSYVHTDNNFTDVYKNKLIGIETGAQVNTVTGVKGSEEDGYRTGNIEITKTNIGLGHVDNTSDADKPISTLTQAALNQKQDALSFDNIPTENSDNLVKSGVVYSALAGKLSSSLKGANNGVAELDENGKVPSSQLPSFVDDVVEGYFDNTTGRFYTESTYITEIVGESGKIYVSVDTNVSYRWGGTEWVEISSSLALGETSSTAYPGHKGKANADAIDDLEASVGNIANLQTAIKTNLVSAINEVKSGKSDAGHSHSNAVASSNGSGGSAGFMSAPDKEKLDGLTAMSEIEIETAFDVSHDVDPYEGDSSNRFLRGDKTWVVPNAVANVTRSGLAYTATKMDGTSFTFNIPTGTTSNTVSVGNHTHPVMGGATQNVAGTPGFVPTPLASEQYKFLRGDGTWALPAGIQSIVVYDESTGVDVSTTLNISSLSGYSYVEIYYSQGIGIGCAKGIINNGITPNAIQLIKYEYNSNDLSLSIKIGSISVNNSTLSLSGGNTFKIFRVVGYK